MQLLCCEQQGRGKKLKSTTDMLSVVPSSCTINAYTFIFIQQGKLRSWDHKTDINRN